MAILDNIPGWKVFSTGIGIALLCVVGYFAYSWFWASPADLSPLEEQAVEAAVDKIVQEYVDKVKSDGDQDIVVMPVRGDTTNDQIRTTLLDRLNAADGVRASKPKDPTLEERATKIFKELWRSDDGTEEGPDPSRVFEDSGEIEEVLSVQKEKLFGGRESSICKLNVRRLEKFTKQDTTIEITAIPPKQYIGKGGTAAVDDTIDPEAGIGFGWLLLAFLWRVLAVAAFAVFFPFILGPALRAVFRQDNNLLNAGIWLFLTAADIVLIFALVSFNPGVTAIIGASILLPFALFYNLKAMNYIEEQV